MSRYLGSKMILEENWERYRRRWSSDENNVDDLGDDKEGWISVVGALEAMGSSSSGGGWSLSLLRWLCHLMNFLWILIGGNERGVKKRKIRLYGTWFGEELSEIRRFEVLGMEETWEEAMVAQQLWFREYL